MSKRVFAGRQKQQGAILVISLMFLVAITLLTVSSMRSSNIGLHMAQNEESRVAAIQSAQALADVIVANPASTPVVGESGHTACTDGQKGCDQTGLPVADSQLALDVANDHLSARVERTGAVFRPPPRSVSSKAYASRSNSARRQVWRARGWLPEPPWRGDCT